MTVMREYHMKLALTSVRELVKIIDQLTDEEVMACLQLEVDTQRRQTIVNRLIANAAERNRQHFIKSLKEKLYGPQQLRRHEQERNRCRQEGTEAADR